MADNSKVRMNLAAIKKVDPYAREIVDSSSHVAFYTFNAENNEWEKTDVEGAFFVYSRSAVPYNSIFINNRLNTTSFVEPITCQLEVQTQPPFLLYRNERSRIRGFWFYNPDECERIGHLVSCLLKQIGDQTTAPAAESKEPDVNIFTLLSKAQQEYDSQKAAHNQQQSEAQGNVLQFFAAAKPTPTEVSFSKHTFPNPLSVEQLEKQQRLKVPFGAPEHMSAPSVQQFIGTTPNTGSLPITGPTKPSAVTEVESAQLTKFLNSVKKKSVMPPSNPMAIDMDKCASQLSATHLNSVASLKESKPQLLNPEMFEKPVHTFNGPEPLTQTQLVQAFSYLIQNDQDFVHKLHEAYLKTFSKKLVDTYQ